MDLIFIGALALAFGLIGDISLHLRRRFGFWMCAGLAAAFTVAFIVKLVAGI